MIKEKKLFIIIVLFVLVLGTSYFLRIPGFQSKDMLDNFYVMKWDAYHAYTENEIPRFNLSVIHKKSFSKEDLEKHFSNCILVTDKGELVLKFENIVGIENEDYFLSTINYRLSSLEKGKYTAMSLKTSNTKEKKEVISIGRWIIDIVMIINVEDLSFGKVTFIDHGFEWYIIELINNSYSKIRLDKLKFDLSNEVNYEVKTGKDYSSSCTSNDLTVEPNSLRAFCFSFEKEDSFDKYTCVSLRPVLTYTVENENKQLILNTSYYPPILSKVAALELLGK